MSGAFKVLKTAINVSDNLSGPFKVLKSVSKAGDTLKLLKNMDFNKISKTFGAATSTVQRTSSIADVAGTLKKFSKVIPPSTDNILGSLSGSLKNVSTTAAKSLNNVSSPSLLKSAANTNSLSRLKKVALSITSSTSSSKSIARRSTNIISKSDNFASVAKALPPVNKLDDVSGVLKKGKGVISKLDDVGDAGKSLSKKADEIADSGSLLKKSKKGLSFVDKYGTYIQLAVIAYYFQGEARNLLKSSDKDFEKENLSDDPGNEPYEVEKFDNATIVVDKELTLSDTLLSKEVLIGVAVVSILMISI